MAFVEDEAGQYSLDFFRRIHAGAAARFRAERGGVAVTVPSVGLHEMVAMDL